MSSYKIYFGSDLQHDEALEYMAISNQYYDFQDVITAKGVIGTLTHFGYDNLFALEVVNKMKEIGRL